MSSPPPTSTNPWMAFSRGLAAHLLGAGLLLLALALGLRHLLGDLLPPLQGLSVVAGLVLVGLGIWQRLEAETVGFHERTLSFLVVLTGALALFAARAVLPTEWDSISMALRAFGFIVAGGSLVYLLPRPGRRLAVSAMILFHFAGILTAVTAVAPHNGAAAPWLPTTLWNVFYRHYLQFFYLNNAYHFYSPDPGPPTLVWFRIDYEGNKDPYWFKLVERDQCMTRLEYQRLLALTEYTNQPGPAVTPGKFLALYERRKEAGLKMGIPITDSLQEASYQYREPPPLTKLYLGSYVRRVAKSVPHPDDPSLRVKRVRVYRLSHQIVNASQLAAGARPLDPIFYTAFYLGEYTPDGELVPVGELRWQEQMADGSVQFYREKGPDPFLYWMLPIYREVIRPDGNIFKEEDTRLIDMLSRHAGSKSLWGKK